MNGNGAIVELNGARNNGIKDVERMVPLKYLSNF